MKGQLDVRLFGTREIEDGDAVSEGLLYVLVAKTEGDAAQRVNSGEPGEGMQAYMRVYLCFAGTTVLALMEKTRILIHHTAVIGQIRSAPSELTVTTTS